MEGHVKCELFNNAGVLQTTQEKDNTILNTFDNWLNWIANIANVTADSNESVLRATLFSFTGYNTFKTPSYFGLMLNSEGKTVPADTSAVFKKQPLAYAGTGTTATSKVGVLLSTSNILDADNNTIGIRFIWNFPAACATGIIASLSLGQASLYTGNATTMLSGIATTYPNYAGAVDKYASTLTRLMYSFDSAGAMIRHQDTNIEKVKRNVALGATGIAHLPIYEPIVTLNGYTNSYKVLDDVINNRYITVASNAAGNYELLYIDKNTKAVTVQCSLSCANALSFMDFGICGNFVVLLYYASGSTTHLYAVNMSTNTYVTVELPSPTAYNYSAGTQRSICTYNAIEGGYACDVNYSNYGSPRFVECYEKADGTGIEVTTQPAQNGGNSMAANLGTLPFGFVHGFPGTAGCYHVSLGVPRRTVFSICNLDTPITKGASDILKITYDLTWA